MNKKDKRVSHDNKKKTKTKIELPNKETLEAIEEGNRIAYDSNVPSYANIEDLRKALDV